MEIKKTPKADLESKRVLFIEIGLIIALLGVFLAFEWTTKENTIEKLEKTTYAAEEVEEVEITRPDEPLPPPPPEEPQISDDLEIIDDDIKINDELQLNTEDDKNKGVELRNYNAGSGQKAEEVIEDEEIPFAFVEQKPKFNGGDPVTEFAKWISSQIDYPEIAEQNGIQGRVQVGFTVDKNGNVKNVRILRGVDSSLDKEAIRVVSKSPKWEPGRQGNSAVGVTYNFPVVFRLR